MGSLELHALSTLDSSPYLSQMTSFIFQQDIFLSNEESIHGLSCNRTEIAQFISPFLESIEDNGVGLAPIYGSKGQLTILAIASKSQVIVVKVDSKAKKPLKNSQQDSLQDFLCQPTLCKYSMEMDKLATALFWDCNIPIVGGKDLLSVSTADRHSLAARLFALGGENNLSKAAVTRCFQYEEASSNSFQTAALQAWAVFHAASLPAIRTLLEKVPSINTLAFDQQVLRLVSKAVRDGNRLVALRPVNVKNDVHNNYTIQSSGSIGFTSERFKSRIMPTRNSNKVIEIKFIKPDGKIDICAGHVKRVEGRGATINLLRGNLPTSRILSVETIGKDIPTSAESLKSWTILNALQGIIDLSTHPFLLRMWFTKKVSWAATPKSESEPPFHFPSSRELNPSQKKGVDAILSNTDTNRVVVIHGPPGTGKTTVIAAAVTSFMQSSDRRETVWLVAQSNVAVKNIAEKLATVNFLDFKILVSKDFHLDWHEHLYQKIEHNVIRSDDFEPTSIITTERQLLGSRVILCTLGMLSSDRLATITRLVTLQTVIFDEASQIEIGDYLSIVVRFRPTLRKLVFIGDNKQLAPYGTSDVPNMESIFEKEHLCKNAIFLDTQYRMPTPIGEFISENVYKNQLMSRHSITDPQCCRFVNVDKGLEVAHGCSWKNVQEVDIAIIIAKQLMNNQKSFRIITPYDPQRNLLEKGLKEAKLPWEDKCFNIDAFQGNEDDYIIISLVRSAKLGFLRENRRTNVMLTRCKKGMVICTSQKFIEGPAANSLVGKLSKSLPKSAWVKAKQVQDGVRLFV